MIRSFGKRRMTKPEGMLREIHFPEMALTDIATGDGRILNGDGGGSRELPVTIYAQFHNDPGQSGAVVAGAVDYIEFGDDGVVSGYGWVLDDDAGRDLVRYKKAGALRGNSVDLADVAVEYEYDFENEWNSTVRSFSRSNSRKERAR